MWSIEKKRKGKERKEKERKGKERKEKERLTLMPLPFMRIVVNSNCG